MGGPSLACCLLGLLTLTSACYIQNCPTGGKRAVRDAEVRECLSCGPENKGLCFGPSICCGKDLGCLLGSAETARCQEENDLPTPCQSGKTSCGTEGFCAPGGFCCSTNGCIMDSACNT